MGHSLSFRSLARAIRIAHNRVGGRCFSLDGFFPVQVAERGGEFIDNLHKTMLGYAQRFKLVRTARQIVYPYCHHTGTSWKRPFSEGTSPGPAGALPPSRYMVPWSSE